MALVYHLMPKSLIGTTLYSLNQMRETMPDVYVQQIRKYEGREILLERRIPLLNCLWNDVVFFSPVHPQTIRTAFLDAGKTWTPARWIEIDPAAYDFDDTNTVIYRPDIQREKGDFTLHPDCVTPFRNEDLIGSDLIPQATQDYYRSAHEQGERIMVWRGVAHVLHRGAIALEQAQIFEL